jgi:hypothetical protein
MVRSMGLMGIEGRAEMLRIAHRHDGEVGGIETLFGYPQDVGASDGGERALILLDEIPGVAVILVIEQAVEGFGLAVEGKHEAVERRVLGGLELGVGYLGGAKAVDFGEDDLDGFGGGRRLGAAGDLKQTGMVVVAAPAGGDVVGVAHPGAH